MQHCRQPSLRPRKQHVVHQRDADGVHEHHRYRVPLEGEVRRALAVDAQVALEHPLPRLSVDAVQLVARERVQDLCRGRREDQKGEEEERVEDLVAERLKPSATRLQHRVEAEERAEGKQREDRVDQELAVVVGLEDAPHRSEREEVQVGERD